MKKKKQDKFHIDLDLTSMLDVIFIILMVVMCQLRFDAKSEAQNIEELTAELAEAEETADMYKSQLEAIENEDKEVAFLMVRAKFDANDPALRTISMFRDTETSLMDDITIRPDNEDEGFGNFEKKLDEYLVSADAENMPVLLTLIDDRILYRDHVRISAILDELKEAHPNLFIRNGEE